MFWLDPEYIAGRMEEGNRSSLEMAHEGDEAISRLLGTDEHDAATAALCRVIEARDGTSDDPLAVLETLSHSEAISKWQALHDKIVGLAEVLHTGLPDDTLGDGSVRGEHEAQDAYFKVEDGYLSRFRRAEFDIGEGPTSFPSDVAVYLMECSARVLERLKELQRCCGQQAPLVKHDHFVRLCHQVTDHTAPPQQFLALDSPTGTDTVSHGSTPAPTAAEVPDPLLVDAVGGEVPPQQVRNRLGPLVGAGQAPATAAGASLQALAGHGGLHRLLGHLAARPAQSGAHPGRAVGAV